MNTFQRTIAKNITFSGIGLHTGLEITITLKPNKINTGCSFVRIDDNNTIIEATIKNIQGTNRSTTIGKNGTYIQTIEHLMAAIQGLQIDNILIEINGPEVPIFDGSAQPFTNYLKQAGIKKQNIKKDVFTIKKTLHYKHDKTEFIISPSDKFELDVTIDFNTQVLNRQRATLIGLENFNNKIAKARTFCFLHELKYLLDKNLIKGGDLNNAIVYVEDSISSSELTFLKKSFNKPNIKIGNNRILNNVDLRFNNEAAKHKLLDLLGDLSLIGFPIKGKIKAIRPGHKANIELAKFLYSIISKEKRNNPPKVNLNNQPLYTKEKIKKILPHRDPFLLIDEIIDLNQNTVIGVKYVDKGEYYFKGHFPKNPIMPGVLQIEAMAQVGGILALNTVPDPENYLTYFLKIENARFKKKVIPGDIIIFKLDLISPIKRGLCQMEGKGFVDNMLVCEATLLAQIVKEY